MRRFLALHSPADIKYFPSPPVHSSSNHLYPFFSTHTHMFSAPFCQFPGEYLARSLPCDPTRAECTACYLHAPNNDVRRHAMHAPPVTAVSLTNSPVTPPPPAPHPPLREHDEGRREKHEGKGGKTLFKPAHATTIVESILRPGGSPLDLYIQIRLQSPLAAPLHQRSLSCFL